METRVTAPRRSAHKAKPTLNVFALARSVCTEDRRLPPRHFPPHGQDIFRYELPQSSRVVVFERSCGGAVPSSDEVFVIDRQQRLEAINNALSHLEGQLGRGWRPTSKSGASEEHLVRNFMRYAASLRKLMDDQTAAAEAWIATPSFQRAWEKLLCLAREVSDLAFLSAASIVVSRNRVDIRPNQNLAAELLGMRINDRMYAFGGKSYIAAIVASKDPNLRKPACRLLWATNVFYRSLSLSVAGSASAFADATGGASAFAEAAGLPSPPLAFALEEGMRIASAMCPKFLLPTTIAYQEIKELAPPAHAMNDLCCLKWFMDRCENSFLDINEIGTWASAVDHLEVGWWEGTRPNLLPCVDPTGRVDPDDLLQQVADHLNGSQLTPSLLARGQSLSQRIDAFSEDSCSEGTLMHKFAHLFRHQQTLRGLAEEVEGLGRDLRLLDLEGHQARQQLPRRVGEATTSRGRRPGAKGLPQSGAGEPALLPASGAPEAVEAVGPESQALAGQKQGGFERAPPAANSSAASAPAGDASCDLTAWEVVLPVLPGSRLHFTDQPRRWTESSRDPNRPAVSFPTRLALASEIRAMVVASMDPGRCRRGAMDDLYSAARSLSQHLAKHTDGKVCAEAYVAQSRAVFDYFRPQSTRQRSDRPEELALVLQPRPHERFYGCWGLDGRLLSFCDRATCPLEQDWSGRGAEARFSFAQQDLGPDQQPDPCLPLRLRLADCRDRKSET